MKKKNIIAFVLPAFLLFFATVFASAEGNREQFCPGPGQGQGRFNTDQNANLEEVTLTGKLILKSNEWPQLASGGKVYVLRYPQRLNINLDVKDGEEITVKGYICPRVSQANNQANNNDQQYLRVTQATIKGKEYILPLGGRHGGRGRGPMMGNSNSCNQGQRCW